MNSWQEDRDMVAAAIKTFPKEFGLRAFPGDRFRISLSSSYVNDSGEVTLYTERYCGKADETNPSSHWWRSFAKGSVAELRRELVVL
jgi:hypothetical protein